jgi:hypothetical protein
MAYKDMTKGELKDELDSILMSSAFHKKMYQALNRKANRLKRELDTRPDKETIKLW